MNMKPQAPGQWAQQQKMAEKKDEKKRSEKQPQMGQSSGGAESMKEPRKKHGDKMEAGPGRPKSTTPEEQGGIAGP